FAGDARAGIAGARGGHDALDLGLTRLRRRTTHLLHAHVIAGTDAACVTRSRSGSRSGALREADPRLARHPDLTRTSEIGPGTALVGQTRRFVDVHRAVVAADDRRVLLSDRLGRAARANNDGESKSKCFHHGLLARLAIRG